MGFFQASSHLKSTLANRPDLSRHSSKSDGGKPLCRTEEKFHISEAAGAVVLAASIGGESSGTAEDEMLLPARRDYSLRSEP